MSQPPESFPSRKNRWVIPCLILLVALPILYQGFSGEVDRWRAAQVMESWLDGEKGQSIAKLKEISQRLPDDHGLKVVLAKWILDLGAIDGNAKHAAEALELLKDIPDQYQDAQSIRLQRNCLLAMGKHEEALLAYRAANPADEERSIREQVQHKNDLAYYQALADQELQLALSNSHEVVRFEVNEWNKKTHILLAEHMQGMFCSALVYWRQIDRLALDDSARRQDFGNKAIKNLSAPILGKEAEYVRLKIQVDELTNATASLEEESPTDEASSSDSNESEPGGAGTEPENLSAKEKLTKMQESKENAAHALATMLTLRALMYQDMGQSEKSFADRRQVTQLGYMPETMARKLPTLKDCVSQLDTLASYLDTRGCVLYKLNHLPAAFADLNVAVTAKQTLVDVAEFVPRTSLETSLDPRQQFEMFVRQPRRSLAALMFHRSWVLRGGGDQKGARADITAVRELGFVPGNYLF